jgi:hypothetical protein
VSSSTWLNRPALGLHLELFPLDYSLSALYSCFVRSLEPAGFLSRLHFVSEEVREMFLRNTRPHDVTTQNDILVNFTFTFSTLYVFIQLFVSFPWELHSPDSFLTNLRTVYWFQRIKKSARLIQFLWRVFNYAAHGIFMTCWLRMRTMTFWIFHVRQFCVLEELSVRRVCESHFLWTHIDFP